MDREWNECHDFLFKELGETNEFECCTPIYDLIKSKTELFNKLDKHEILKQMIINKCETLLDNNYRDLPEEHKVSDSSYANGIIQIVLDNPQNFAGIAYQKNVLLQCLGVLEFAYPYVFVNPQLPEEHIMVTLLRVLIADHMNYITNQTFYMFSQCCKYKYNGFNPNDYPNFINIYINFDYFVWLMNLDIGNEPMFDNNIFDKVVKQYLFY